MWKFLKRNRGIVKRRENEISLQSKNYTYLEVMENNINLSISSSVGSSEVGTTSIHYPIESMPNMNRAQWILITSVVMLVLFCTAAIILSSEKVELINGDPPLFFMQNDTDRIHSSIPTAPPTMSDMHLLIPSLVQSKFNKFSEKPSSIMGTLEPISNASFVPSQVFSTKTSSNGSLEPATSPSETKSNPLVDTSHPSTNQSFEPMIRLTNVPPVFSLRPSSFPSFYPTISKQPSSAPSISYEFFFENIISNITISNASLINVSSPQAKAKEWMLLNNQRRDRDAVSTLQRFALATFYFSLNGDGWNDNKNFLLSNVHECEWTGIFCDMNNMLTMIVFDSNAMNGTIPEEMILFSELKSLVLTKNFISGTIPHALTSLTNLQELSLSQNLINGTIPSEIGNLKHLKYLGLDSNKLTGKIPVEVRELSILTTLNLNCNLLSGRIPLAIQQLKYLQFLNLDANRLSRKIPSEIGMLTNLAFVNFNKNELTGTIPSQLFNLPNLVSLDLSSNQLRGQLPVPSSSSRLSFLSVENNRLKKKIPTEIGRLEHLAILNLSKNKISGSIPSSIQNMTKIYQLQVSFNELSGTLPTEMFLPSLQKLDLSRNNLKGTIPSDLINAPKLKEIDLSNNNLSGTLPCSIASLQFLSDFNIHRNKIKGSIPSEIGQLTQLRQFIAYKNKLTNSVPFELSTLNELETLRLDENELTGTIHKAVCFLKYQSLRVFWTDCASNRNGEIEVVCDCCDRCCSSLEKC